MTENTGDTIPAFVAKNFANAAGILSKVLGYTSNWDDLWPLTDTFKSLRAVPENFQNEVGLPVVVNILEVIGISPGATPTTEQIGYLATLDPVIAAAVDDAYTMAYQNATEQLQQKKKTRATLLRGR